MKLLVNLFYILISIFITGIVLCIFVDKNSVFSRVAVGLVTGSFVAGVNALTSYLYQRKRFFRGLVSSMKEVGEALYDDFEKAFIHADYILTKPNEELRKSIPEYMEAREKESSRKDHHYKQLYRCFDYQEFTPMIKTSFYYNLEGWYEDFKNMFLSNYIIAVH